MNIKTEITKLHYNKNASGVVFCVLKLAAVFYSLGSGVKNLLYNKGIIKPHKVGAYVISVGNITTGGVGKTPVSAVIADYFTSKGEKTAIISRGYGGKLSNKNVNLISDGEKIYYNARMAGDEPYWLSKNTKAIVITSKNRVKAAKSAIKKLGVTKIVLDDGFQHRKLHRDLDIVLCDSEKFFGNENLLPAGPLREDKKSLNRADKFIIVSKNTDHTKAESFAKIMEEKFRIKTLVCKIEPDCVYNIKTGKTLPQGSKVTALSAIAQPEQFYKFLSNYDVINTITFDDHHQYMKRDINSISGNIITTEKDAVKLAVFGFDNIYALKLKTILDIEELLK